MPYKRFSLIVSAVAAAALLLMISRLYCAQSKSINWLYDFNKGVKQAAKLKKPMMVDFYAEWCGWCKKLDSETYSDSRVIDLSRKFVNVKVNGDKHRDLMDKYGIEGYPTIVFLNASAKEIRRVVGYQGPDEFLKSMRDALKKAR